MTAIRPSTQIGYKMAQTILRFARALPVLPRARRAQLARRAAAILAGTIEFTVPAVQKFGTKRVTRALYTIRHSHFAGAVAR